MSARFDRALTTYLVSTPPVAPTYPLTVGIWVQVLLAGSTQNIWVASSAASAADQLAIYYSSGASQFVVWATVGGGGGGQCANGTVVVGGWAFVLFRWISTTNRRLSVVNTSGAVTHGSSTTSQNPTLAKLHLGGHSFATPNCLTGNIAEYWVARADVQANGEQIQNALLRQLAYRGPFSVPHIAKDIVEYRSFRSRIDSRSDRPDEVYCPGTQPVWTNTNGVTIGAHPPHAATWRKPPGVAGAAPMVLV